MNRQRIGTNEYIVICGEPQNPETVFYVREFEAGEIRNVIEALPTAGGWAAQLENGKVKVFSQRWLEAVFME